jgi:serine/threonine protein phosphatase 1
VVGDIHGRLDCLVDLHAKIDADTERSGFNAKEIYLGDYIDRGPASAAVIHALLERADARDIVLLKGNHEEMLERALAGRLQFGEWRALGGGETLLSYDIDPRDIDEHDARALRNALLGKMPSRHMEFLFGLRHAYELAPFFFVHAGVRPGVPLSRQKTEDLLWIRDEFLNHDSDFGRIVVHGHSPVHQPEFRANRINLDTAAYATGRLTCLKLNAAGATLLGSTAAT